MKKIKITKTNIDAFLIMLIFFCWNAPWPFWGVSSLLGFTISSVLFVFHFKHIITRKVPWLFFLLVIFPIFLLLPSIRGGQFSNFIYVAVYIICFSLPCESLTKALIWTTKVLAYIILISLPLWLIHVFVHELSPYSSIDITDIKGAQTFMNNYIVFVENSIVPKTRFYSVFDEPGLLGTLAALVLFGNRYNLRKWENFIIFLGALFTYSTAFYILTAIGVVFIYIKSPKKILLFSAFFLIITSAAFLYLQDNEAFQQNVVYRFTENGVDGQFETRSNFYINKAVDELFKSRDFMFGLGKKELQEKKLTEGYSYKNFLLQYGIAGIIVLLLIYVTLLRGKYTRENLSLLLIFIASFLQRPGAWTSWQMLLFCCIASTLSLNKKQKEQQTVIKE